MDITTDSKAGNLPFSLLVLYIFMEYGRPQEIFPAFGVLRFPAILTILLTLFLFFSKDAKISSKQTNFFFLMLALMLFHVPIALNNFIALDMLKITLIYFILYLNIIISVDSFPKFQKLINVFLAIHIYLAIYGVFKGGGGIGGHLGDENDFALALNMIIPFPFFLALLDIRKRLFLIAATLLFLSTVILTFSRGGFVGLLAVGICCWLRSPKKKRLLSTLFITIMILFVYYYSTESYWNRVKSIQEHGVSTGTGEERVYSWKLAWKMFLDNPILGVGQGNYAAWVGEYQIEGGLDTRLHRRSLAGRAAHSVYFTLIAELGIVGTIAFLGMLYHAYKDLFLIRKKISNRFLRPDIKEINTIFYLSYAMEASLIGYMVSGTFISVFYYVHFWILIGFVASLRRIVEGYHENHSTSAHV
jgi:probable O-glycosylation ligase (exosortase A-associated)